MDRVRCRQAALVLLVVVLSACADEAPTPGVGSTANNAANGAANSSSNNTAANSTNNTTNSANNANNSDGCAGPMCAGVCCGVDDVCVQGACAPRASLCGFTVCAADEVCEGEVCRIACDTVRCGAQEDVCCAAGEVCVFEACRVPGAACATDVDCGFDEFCESSLGFCIPTSADPNACVYVPPTGDFAPVQEWAWSGEGAFGEFNQVMMMPAVANLTDDNGDGVVNADDTPDVVFTAFAGNRYNDAGVLRILAGDTGQLEYEHQVGARAGNCPALADLDGDGVAEILVERAADAGEQAVMALRVDGTLLWANPGASTGSGGVSVADLDADGSAEVIAVDRIIGAEGQTRCTFPAGSGVPVALDLDLDGTQEIFSGAAAFGYAVDGGACPMRWTSPVVGLPAVGNFDEDAEAELVVVGGGLVAVIDHEGRALWSQPIPIDPARVQEEYMMTCASTTCDSSDPSYFKGCCPGGGPPTVADGTILWAHKTHDFSSAVTGSSVFDFEGDGRAEVVYNDEFFLRIYDGSGAAADTDQDGFRDAVILFEEPNPSGTLLEYPLIVDVDNDGNAEIVVAANNYAFPGVTGLRVFGDARDNWVRTRRIWNQHAYHVTHTTEAGQVVSGEPAWWQARQTNSFRLNVQPDGLFNAPNLAVEGLTWDEAQCPASLTLRARVANIGSLGVREGVAVSFWLGEVGAGTLLCEAVTEVPLPPGARTEVSCVWTVPEGSPLRDLQVQVAVDVSSTNLQGEHNECVEDDNIRAYVAQCLPPG